MTKEQFEKISGVVLCKKDWDAVRYALDHDSALAAHPDVAARWLHVYGVKAFRGMRAANSQLPVGERIRRRRHKNGSRL